MRDEILVELRAAQAKGDLPTSKSIDALQEYVAILGDCYRRLIREQHLTAIRRTLAEKHNLLPGFRFQDNPHRRPITSLAEYSSKDWLSVDIEVEDIGLVSASAGLENNRPSLVVGCWRVGNADITTAFEQYVRQRNPAAFGEPNDVWYSFRWAEPEELAAHDRLAAELAEMAARIRPLAKEFKDRHAAVMPQA